MITRSVLTIDLRDDPAAIESYREHHERVWPEVLASLRAAGVRDMNIYLQGRRLVMVVDTEDRDFRGCFAIHATSDPRVIEWEALMRTLQQPAPGTPPGDWWAQMEPVFSLAGAGSTPPERHASPRN
jgi:L-rhamnose mutarotase